jgi:NAD-dependent SIR2 family protein deacetylase
MRKKITCTDCESQYTLVWEEDEVVEDKPNTCPFCGTELEGDVLDLEHLEDEDEIDIPDMDE